MAAPLISPAGKIASRYYRGEADLRDMQALLMEARSQTSDWRYEHVGELMWNFFMVACHLNPHKFVRLWHTWSGKLVAYALLGEDPSLDFQVLPACWGMGIEADILKWAFDKACDITSPDSPRHELIISTPVYLDDHEKISFLTQHGFRVGAYREVNLMRSLDEPIPEVALPGGFRIRSMIDENEAAGRAAAQHAVWQPWSVGNITGRDYAHLMRMPGYRRELDIVAVAADGSIAAYANAWIDPINRVGDFGPVGTLPEFRRQGLCRAVLVEGLRKLKANGVDRVEVSTGEANQAARQLYGSIGFKLQNHCSEYQISV